MNGVTIESLVSGALVGVAATVTMDVLGAAGRRVGLCAGAKGQWVGRWYLGIVRGRFFHPDIAAVPAQAGEQRLALIGHYVIGIVLAAVYVLGAGWLGLSPRALPVALGYGLATCVFPWFLVYPALGFGPLGLRGPSQLKLLITSLLNHLCYGFGLWWAAQMLRLGSP